MGTRLKIFINVIFTKEKLRIRKYYDSNNWFLDFLSQIVLFLNKPEHQANGEHFLRICFKFIVPEIDAGNITATDCELQLDIIPDLSSNNLNSILSLRSNFKCNPLSTNPTKWSNDLYPFLDLTCHLEDIR